jgi:hypothetical protein
MDDIKENIDTTVKEIPSTEIKSEVKEETPEQINWKKFRQERDRDRKEREAAVRKAQEKEMEAQALKAAMESILSKPVQQDQAQEETEDDRIQKKINEALEKERQRQQQLEREREAKDLPTKLTQVYNDFDQVCSTENLDYLEFHYPEVARAFHNMPDSFNKWSDVYKAVRRFIPNVTSNKEQKKAEANFSKPQAMSSPGKTATGDGAPIMIDDKRRADNWARMQRVMKGA